MAATALEGSLQADSIHVPRYRNRLGCSPLGWNRASNKILVHSKLGVLKGS